MIITVEDIKKLKALADGVRDYWKMFPPDRWVKNGLSVPGRALLDAVDELERKTRP